MIEIVQTQSVTTDEDKNTQKIRLENYFHITKVTESELMTVKEGMHLLLVKYQKSHNLHMDGCGYRNLKTYEGCKQYTDGIVDYRRTCSEDLMFLHGQMATIHQWIYSVEELGL